MQRDPFRLCLTILQQHLTLWYYFKQLLLLFKSIHHLLPPPTVPLLLSPAFVVRRPSSAACFCRNLVACCLRHHPLSSHCPQSLSDVVASSAVSVWSCHIVHLQPSARRHRCRHHRCNPLLPAAHCLLLSRCPPAANSVAMTPFLLQLLLSRRPTASATTSTLLLSPLSPDAVVARH